MKHQIIIPYLLAITAILIIGCASLQTQQGQDALRQGAQVTAYGFSCWTLSLSKGDAQDLADKKAVLVQVDKYLKIAKEQGLPAAQVGAGLLNQVPANEHWKTFIDAIKQALGYATGVEAQAIISGLITGIENALMAFV